MFCANSRVSREFKGGECGIDVPGCPGHGRHLPVLHLRPSCLQERPGLNTMTLLADADTTHQEALRTPARGWPTAAPARLVVSRGARSLRAPAWTAPTAPVTTATNLRAGVVGPTTPLARGVCRTGQPPPVEPGRHECRSRLRKVLPVQASTRGQLERFRGAVDSSRVALTDEKPAIMAAIRSAFFLSLPSWSTDFCVDLASDKALCTQENLRK